MPLRQLPLMELDWQPPVAPVIDAALLNAQLHRVSVLRDAEREAAAILKAASRKAERIVCEANKTQRQMHAMAQEELARLQQQMLRDGEAGWMQAHVVSMREDEALERHIVQAVSARIHDCIKQVLTAWFYQQPSDETLCDRLTAQVVQMAEERGLQLYVHQDMMERAQDKFGTLLTVKVNPALARDEAVLASSQLSLSVSPHRHFQQLLKWLRTTGDKNSDVETEHTPCARRC